MASSTPEDAAALLGQIATLLTKELPKLEDRTRNAVMGQLENVHRQLLDLQSLMKGEQD